MPALDSSVGECNHCGFVELEKRHGRLVCIRCKSFNVVQMESKALLQLIADRNEADMALRAQTAQVEQLKTQVRAYRSAIMTAIDDMQNLALDNKEWAELSEGSIAAGFKNSHDRLQMAIQKLEKV